MRQIAIYGKGGIGKSTVAAHLSYSLAKKGHKVLQMGCSPKNDSTRPLLQSFCPTVIDVLGKHEFEYDEIEPGEIIFKSPLTFDHGGEIFCAESGGPEPGIGCGGKGVIEAIEALSRLEIVDEYNIDVIIYDILGDVVCGGFSLPIRKGYAEETYVVTSGELEALYQVTNVSKAIRRFKKRSGAKLGGIIVNLRRMKNEEQMVKDFAETIGTQVVGITPYSQLVKELGGQGKTVFEGAPDSDEATIYKEMADRITENKNFVLPKAMEFKELYEWWLQYID